MSLGGGSNTTTQTTSNEPASWAKPIFNQTSQDALDVYNSGMAAPVNTMSTVVPYADQSTQSFGAQENLANANMNGQGISGQAQGIINAGGYNPAQQQSMDYLSQVSTNPYDLSGNSAYQTYRSNTLNDTANQVNSIASRFGALGSDDNTGRLTRELGRVGNEMDMGQFARNDALNAQRFGMGQQGISNLGTAYDMQNLPIQDLRKVGAAYEDLYGRNLNDQLRIAQEQQTAPMRGIEWLQAIGSGGGQFGTSTSTSQQPGQNPFLTMLGGLSTGIGLLG